MRLCLCIVTEERLTGHHKMRDTSMEKFSLNVTPHSVLLLVVEITLGQGTDA